MKLRVNLGLSLCLPLAGAFLIGSAHPSTKRLLAVKRVFGSMSEHTLKVPAKASPDDSRARLVDSYGRMRVNFEPNIGQTDPRVKFLSRGHAETRPVAAAVPMFAMVR